MKLWPIRGYPEMIAIIRLNEMTNRNLTNRDKEVAKSLARKDNAVIVSANWNKQNQTMKLVEHSVLFVLFIVPSFATNRPKQLDYPSA